MFLGLPTLSLPLVKLFDTPFLFTVPAYQRAYSWTTREAGQLLEDLAIAAGLDDQETAAPDYFLGTIILLDPDAEGPSVPDLTKPRVYEVVDGQQRLITLSILAGVLRDKDDEDAARAEDDACGVSCADALDRMLAAGSIGMDPLLRAGRIVLRDSEQAFLHSQVVTRGPRPALPENDGQADGAGIRYVQQHLASAVEAMSRAERRKLSRYLMDWCHVVVIISRDIDRAHRLFTVLNERGKPLERKDIIKAEVLRSVPAEGTALALAHWDRAHSVLGYEFDVFLGHLRLIHGLQRMPVISGVRTLVRRHGSQRFLEDQLSPLANAFHQVRTFPQRAESGVHPELTGALVALNRHGNGDWVPAAILAMADYRRAPDRASQLMVEIERLASLLRLLCYGSGKRQRRFAPVIEAIREGEADLLTSRVWEITRDEQRTIAHHLKDLHRRNPGMAKLVLMRVEDDLAGLPLRIDPSDLTVEHVLPLRPAPTSEWRRIFVDTEERAAYQASIGNLALVTTRQNDRAKNKDFADKLAIYREPESGAPALISNSAILNGTRWLPDDIRAREELLFGVISRIWRLDLAAIPASPAKVLT
jgi:hypothetical protein